MMIYDPTVKPVLGSRLKIGHPLARGLKAWYAMLEGSGGKVLDLSGNGKIGVFDTIYTPTWSSTNFGPAIQCSASIAQSVLTNYTPSNTSTIACWVVPEIVAVTGRVWSCGLVDMELLIYASKYNLYGNGYDIYPATAPAAIDVPAFIVCCVTQGVLADLWFNGILVGSDAAINSATLEPLRFFATPGGTGAKSKISMLYAWNRILSESEIQQLYREPFCMIERIPFELYAVAASGGGAVPPPPGGRALVIGRPPGVYSTKQCIAKNFVYI